MSLAAETLVWSKSQVATLHECRRKYGLQRRAAKKEQGDEGLRFLSGLRNRHLWAGAVAHEGIGEILKNIRQGEPLENEDVFIMKWRDRMREEFRASKEGDRKQLFEHVYEVPVGPDEWRRKWDIVERSLRWFYRSSWPARFQALGPECWKAVDDLLRFEVGDAQAYVKIDCAIFVKDRFILIDWVAGPLRESSGRSLAVAALYAHEVWEAQPEQIDAWAVSLANGDKRPVPIDEEVLMEAQLKIQEETQFLAEHAPVEGDDPMALPQADTLAACAACNFQRLCHPQGILAGR